MICIHDLEAATCSVCNGADKRLQAEREPALTIGPVFPARYAGRCSGCGAGFDPGDLICGDGSGGYLCEGCCDEWLPF